MENSTEQSIELGNADTEKPLAQLDTEQIATLTNSVVAANNDFGFDLYRQLAVSNEGDNLFLSPYSISSALAMTMEGARGVTAQEMNDTLRMPSTQTDDWSNESMHQGLRTLTELLTGTDTHSEAAAYEAIAEAQAAFDAAQGETSRLSASGDWAALDKAIAKEQRAADVLNSARAKVDQYELRVANSLWGEQTYPFAEEFIATINKHYGTSGVFTADFISNFPSERTRINTWVEDQTNKRIKNLIPKLRPDEARALRLILVNAIYFKGDWSEPFDKTATSKLSFTLENGATVPWQIMQNNALASGRYAAFESNGDVFLTPKDYVYGTTAGLYPGGSGFAALEMPYKGGDLSMLLISPNSPDGLPTIEQKITASMLQTITAALEPRETQVLVPRFKLETSYFLTEPLVELGMKRAFEQPPLPNGADFSAMTLSKEPQDQLYISKVVHKAFLEVTEEGTEAAAATAAMMLSPTSAPRSGPFTPVFKADRPFLFIIRDKRTGAVLFLGRLNDPRA